MELHKKLLYFLIFIFIISVLLIPIAHKNKWKYIEMYIALSVTLFFALLSIIGYNYYKSHNKKVMGITTNEYELITRSNDLYNSSSFWRPKDKLYNKVVYKPLGDVDNYDINNKPTKPSILVSTKQTTKPVDYKLTFKNDDQKIYGWTPKAENGYTCLGDVITNTFVKPSTDLIRCVPNEWVKEIKNISDVSPYNTKTGSIWVGSFENRDIANLLRTNNTSEKSLLPVYDLKDLNYSY
jgi:hypothetical protein